MGCRADRGHQWLFMKELGDYYYKIHNRNDQDSEENPFEKEERVRCQEEKRKEDTSGKQ